MLTWDIMLSSWDMHWLFTWQVMPDLRWCRELIKVVLRIDDLLIVVTFLSESSVAAFRRVSTGVDGLTVVSIDLSLREVFVVLWIMHGSLILVVAFTPVWLLFTLLINESREDSLEVESACWRNGFMVMSGAV